MKPIELFYHNQPEPLKSCLLAMRSIILAEDDQITEAWKYGMPFFCYKGKMFCYLWVHKKYGCPYLGLVEGKHIKHDYLLQEQRSRMKILLLKAEEDIPITMIHQLLRQALSLYKNGIIPIKR